MTVGISLCAVDVNAGRPPYRRVLTPFGITAIDLNSDRSGPGNRPADKPPALAFHGFRVTFESRATDLSDQDDRENLDVFHAFAHPDAPAARLGSGHNERIESRDGDSFAVWFDTTSSDGDSYDIAMNANGRSLAFVSTSTDLVEDDHNGTTDVFSSGFGSRGALLESVAAESTRSGNGPSYSPSVGVTGRVIAFVSDASNLIAERATRPGNLYARVFSRRTRTLETLLVSANPLGLGGNGRTRGRAAINAKDRFVAFASDASDLVPGDTNGRTDIFVRDLKRDRTTLVSVNASGAGGGNGDSLLPSISANGRFVVFVSDASDLVPGDDNGARDVFVFDRSRGRTRLVSVRADGDGSGNGASGSGWTSRSPSISANGRFVAFVSDATDLTDDAVGGSRNVFVRDIRRRRTRLASTTSGGVRRSDGVSTAPAISSNGRLVAFTSDAFEIPEGTAPYGVFVRDMRLEGADFIHDTALREAVSSTPRRIGRKKRRPANRIFGFVTGYASEEGSVFVVRMAPR